MLVTYTFSCDWNDDGDFSDANENLTPNVLKAKWTRGRSYGSHIHGRSQPGKLTMTLSNLAGIYSPTNAASPLFGNLLQGRKVRVIAGEGGTNYTRFTGRIDKIIPRIGPFANRPEVEITALGMLDDLAYVKPRTTVFEGLNTYELVQVVLDYSRKGYAEFLEDDNPVAVYRLNVPEVALPTGSPGSDFNFFPDSKMQFGGAIRIVPPPANVGTEQEVEYRFGTARMTRLLGEPDGAIGFLGAGIDANGELDVLMPINRDPWTVEMWVKLNDFPASPAFKSVFTTGGDGSTGGVEIRINTSGGVRQLAVVRSIFGSPVTVNVISNTTVKLNTLQHIAASYDGTTLRLYVDGVSVGTPATDTANNVNPDIRVGWNGGGAATLMSVGPIAFYDYAVSATRIAAHAAYNFIGTELAPFNAAAHFTAANSERLTHVDDALLELGDNDVTVALLIRPDDIGADRSLLAKYATAGNQRSWFLQRLSTNRLVFAGSSDGAAVSSVSPTLTLAADTWYFVCGRYNATSNTLSLSIDGQFSGTGFASGSHAAGFFNSTAAFEIGARNGAEFWDGEISRVAIWKARELTDAEVTALRASWQSGSFVLPDGYATGLLGYWPLYEFSTGAAAVTRMDRGPNALHLTDTNTVTSEPSTTEWTNVDAWWADGSKTGLDLIRELENTEFGFFRELGDGTFVFEDKAYRLRETTSIVSQHTLTDTPAVSLFYLDSAQLEDLKLQIVNIAEATGHVLDSNEEAEVILWELGPPMPTLGPGETKRFLATFNGDGYWRYRYTTDAGVIGPLEIEVLHWAVLPAATSAVLFVRNLGSSPVTLTHLRFHGQTWTRHSPPTMYEADDPTSIATYKSERQYRNTTPWLYGPDKAQAYADMAVYLLKDPTPLVRLPFFANETATKFHDLMELEISERVTVQADELLTLWGLNEEFFIESISESMDAERGTHNIEFICSSAVKYGANPDGGDTGFWKLGTSTLGVDTRLWFGVA